MDYVEPAGSSAAGGQPGWTDDPAQPAGLHDRVRQPAGPRYRLISDSLAIAPSVAIVMPVMNEAANLPHVFASLPAWIDEIVLVDGRSTDNTVAVARRLHPDVKVVVQDGRGKGDALLAGFAATKSDIIVTIDGDGSNDGYEIISFVCALVAGADFVKGSRFASSGGSADITLGRRWGNWFLGVLVNRMFGTRYTDLCYGYNAFWARHLQALGMECEGFEVEALMNIRAAKAGLRVQEVPSFEYSRIHGASKLRAVTDGWRILRLILREKFSARAGDPAGPWLEQFDVDHPDVAAPAVTGPAVTADQDCA